LVLMKILDFNWRSILMGTNINKASQERI
jgi:hypothetical protein